MNWKYMQHNMKDAENTPQCFLLLGWLLSIFILKTRQRSEEKLKLEERQHQSISKIQQLFTN